MDEHTQQAKQWLDWRYRVGVAEGRYRAHEPVFGVGCSCSEPNHALRLARTYAIFRRLQQMRFETLLDVGGSEGYHASLARNLFSVPAVTSDLSVEANRRARELFGLPAVASDAHWLPYRDNSFDVVLCCEVLEHVSDPVAVMCEVARVARRYAVFSTEQIVRLPREREILLLQAGSSYPHAERNWFLASDFEHVLGGAPTCERQAAVTDRMAHLMNARQEASPEEARALVWEMTRPQTRGQWDSGILVVAAQGGAPALDLAVPGDEALLDAILAHHVAPDQAPVAVADGVDPFLLDRLACPVCLQSLRAAQEQLSCAACGRVFPTDDGIPRMYPDPEQAAVPGGSAPRWPWLNEDGAWLREMFTAPRPAANRLLLHLLHLERGLLDGRAPSPAPRLDYLDSEAVRLALVSPANPPPAQERMWWDELEMAPAEQEAVRALGRNLLGLRTQAEQLSQQLSTQRRETEQLSQQLGRIYSRWPVRALLWAKRLLKGRGKA